MAQDRSGPPVRRAAVVCRHPGTLVQLGQSLGTIGIALRPAISPQLLPHAQSKEFDVVLLDLDIDSAATPEVLVATTAAQCPDSPVICVAGVHSRHRLLEALRHPRVAGVYPKLGTWIEAAS